MDRTGGCEWVGLGGCMNDGSELSGGRKGMGIGGV